MHRIRREGRQAHGDVFGPVGMRRAVLHPLALRRVHRLASLDRERDGMGLHLQLAAQHDGVFVELRGLPGLDPAAGAAHAGSVRWLAGTFTAPNGRTA